VKLPGVAAPVFIIGTERSGSNLLRLILDAHPDIVVPHPPHLVRYFLPLESLYGPLVEEGRFAALVRDMLALVHAHIHPWPWVPAEAELVARVRERTVLGVYVALHEALLAHVGAGRWGCKSTFMVGHVEALRAICPGARFLWLYRDPRDVAASSKESVFSAFAPALTARLWRSQQEQALAAEGPDMLRLPYEALVADPEGTVRGICTFLDEPFDPGMLRWFEKEEATRSAALSESWANTAAPMQVSRLNRYRRDLVLEEVADVEEVAGPMLTALGYAPDLPPRAPLGVLASRWRDLRWALEDDRLWIRVELRSGRKDRNVARRRRRYWLMWRIRWRLVLLGR
jgi:hypothetical protein